MVTNSSMPQEQHPQFGKMSPEVTYSQVVFGESMEVLSRIQPSTVDVIYFDPPSSASLQVDDPEEYLKFLEPRLREAYRVLVHWGWMYIHLDRRDMHRVMILLGSIFGRKSCMNKFLWDNYYDKMTEYRWPDTQSLILAYAKYPQFFIFHPIAVEGESAIPTAKNPAEGYPADFLLYIPTLPEEEKTGYPGQQPSESLKRIIAATTKPGDLVLDFFAGSGTTGEAAHLLGRQFILADNSPAAMEVMRKRLQRYPGIKFVGSDVPD